jgi:hypothetical protein
MKIMHCSVLRFKGQQGENKIHGNASVWFAIELSRVRVGRCPVGLVVLLYVQTLHWTLSSIPNSVAPQLW